MNTPMPEPAPGESPLDNDDPFFDTILEGQRDDEGRVVVDTEPPPPDTEPAADAEPAAEPAPAVIPEPSRSPPQARPRGEDGKFLSDAEIARREAASPEAPAAVPEPPAEAQPAAETPPVEVPPAEGEQFPLYGYRANGVDYELPGSSHGEDGIFISNEGLPALEQLLSRGQGAQAQIANLQTEMNRLRDGRSENEVKAEVFLEKIRGLVKGGEDNFATFIDQLDQNWALVEKDAEIAAMKAESAQDQGFATEARESAEAERVQPLMEEQLKRSIDELAGKPEFAGIDKEKMWNRCHGQLERIFIEGTEEELAATGREGYVVAELADGKIVGFFPDVLQQEFEYAVELTGEKKAVDAAREHNVAAIAESKAPPGLAAAGTTPPVTEKKTPQFKSREESDEWFDKGAEEADWGLE